MELDVLAVGIFVAIVGFAAIMWLGTRSQRRSDGRSAATERARSGTARVDARDYSVLFDWIMERDDWVVLDLETTGYTPRSEIIEIAIVDAHGRTLLEQSVMPKGRIPKDATKIHGIDRKMLKGAPTWPEISDKVAAILVGRPVISYNAEFEVRLLWQTADKWKVPVITIDGHCAMLAYATHRAEPHKWREGEYRWHKLSNAVKVEGISAVQRHRALGDARITRELVLKVAAQRHGIAEAA